MSQTTDFGRVEQEIILRLRDLMPDTVRAVLSATSEQAADKATKAFPALVVVLLPITTRGIRTFGDGGFAVDALATWEVYQYASSGKQDGATRYGTEGIFAVNTAQRERLNGFYPSSLGADPVQIDNCQPLIWQGCRPPEPYQGTGSLKMVSTYTLEQLIATV